MKKIDVIINELIELAPIKIWSLIVTVFGDLSGNQLSGKNIRDLMAPLGIKPEATRVALHRLKKDGWITSQKSGREVTYQLTDQARRATKDVYDDVYGQNLKYPEGWHFLILGDLQGELNDNFPIIRIGRHLALTPKSAHRDHSTTMEIEITEKEIPLWFQNRLISEETMQLSKRLLSYINAYRDVESHASDLQKVLLRLLVLHHWRRIALRPASWAHIALLPDGSIASLQKAATEFLTQTPPTKMVHS